MLHVINLFLDQVDNNKKFGSDSDEDSSKKQKLNEFLPSASTSDNVQDSSPESTSNFRKLESKVRKRNYRCQSDSSDVMEESSLPVVDTAVRPQEENAQEDSNSSKSVDFQPEDRAALSESSDQRSEEYLGIDKFIKVEQFVHLPLILIIYESVNLKNTR